MCSVAEYPYYDEVGGPLLSPIHGKVTCGAGPPIHQTPWIVPISSTHGLDLLGLGGELIIIAMLVFIMFARKKTATGARRLRWPTMSPICGVIATLYILAIVFVTYARFWVR